MLRFEYLALALSLLTFGVSVIDAAAADSRRRAWNRPARHPSPGTPP
jgi:hypothetical protein